MVHKTWETPKQVQKDQETVFTFIGNRLLEKRIKLYTGAYFSHNCCKVPM